MKICPTCGAEIINGENGAAMYDQCFDCRPINYICPARRNVLISDIDILRAEDEYYDMVELYWDC